MACEIEVLPEVEPKKEKEVVPAQFQEERWLAQNANYPSFLHITGACDKEGRPLVVVLGCRLPSKNKFSVKTLVGYLQEHLDELVKKEYVLLYCHSDKAEKKGYPTMEFLHEMYDSLNQNYKKNLKRIVILHATDNLKAAMSMTFKSFISPKVFRKLTYLKYVSDLSSVKIDASMLELPVSVYDNDVRQMVMHGKIETEVENVMIHGEDPLYLGLKKLGKLASRKK